MRIPYFINDTCIITTVGQLNFFMWFISKNIIDYVIKNKEIIEFDMNKTKKIMIIPKLKKSCKVSKKMEIKYIYTTLYRILLFLSTRTAPIGISPSLYAFWASLSAICI